MMDITVFEDRIDKVFEDAEGVDDTIWYSDGQTLYEAIINEIESIISLPANRRYL